MVHELDREIFEEHNSKQQNTDYKFLGHLAPEPWIGNPAAKAIFLFDNPGATSQDVDKKEQKFADEIKAFSLSNLHHEIEDYPHFFFNPILMGSSGHNWYATYFKRLILETSAENVARNVLSCELAPYHSKKWKIPHKPFPTQEFTYNLVRNGMSQGAVIVVVRGEKVWHEKIEGLENYSRKITLKNWQRAWITPNNIATRSESETSSGYEQILDAIR